MPTITAIDGAMQLRLPFLTARETRELRLYGAARSLRVAIYRLERRLRALEREACTARADEALHALAQRDRLLAEGASLKARLGEVLAQV